MKRFLTIAVATLAITGCSELRELTSKENPYDNPFYAKYLTTSSPLDAAIQRTLEAVRQNPDSARAHNDLGMLLVQKGFPKDAEREFERAVNADVHFYPAWYNLGSVRASHGDDFGARHAFYRTIRYKPGHANALFQLGLIEEKRRNVEKAVKLYAKAYSINPALLDVAVNPRILDSRLTHLAMLELYPKKHWKDSIQFQGTPSSYREPSREQAPSPQAAPEKIVPPAAPVTDPSQQQPAPPVPPVTST
jgi:tetratricopeptide (TPR) repeat protein